MTNDATPAGVPPRRSDVLVIEDDPAVRELVALHLRRSGFVVREAASASEGWRLLDGADAVVLDRMLPDESGDRFLRRLRDTPAFADLPVLMLTARASEADRVGGLDAGADDYLTKPYSAAELAARLRALLRRAPARSRQRAGAVTLDLDAARAYVGDREVPLTRREFELAAFLMANPGKAFTRTEILDRVWGEAFVGTERTVDQHVAQLRARLGEDLIQTVRGRGYRLVDADDAG